MDFKKMLLDFDIHLSEEQEKRFELYYEILIRENEKYNLTSITNKDEVFLKHFYDSLSLLKGISLNKDVEICDIGSGAGFPSVPLKICFPNIKVTLVDSLRKRTDFLKMLVHELGLENVRVLWQRAEEVKEKFDIVTARAVARLNVLTELCLPLVSVGGFFVAMKGISYNEEKEEAQNAIDVLGGRIIKTIPFMLPIENSTRGIIVVEKIKQTPEKYPRSYSMIKKKPL